MAFITKKDYAALSDDKLVCASSTANVSSGEVTAPDDYGTIIASTETGGAASPSNNYDVKGELKFVSGTPGTGERAQIKLGKINTVDGKKYMLAGVNFGTSNAAGPTFSANSREVEAGATDEDLYLIPAFTLPTKHHAAMLFSEATLTGDGCYLQSVDYAGSITPSVSNDEQELPISSGAHAGQLTSTITINQTKSAADEPTVTPASGWKVLNALTQDNPKGNYPSWKIVLVKHLERYVAPANT